MQEAWAAILHPPGLSTYAARIGLMTGTGIPCRNSLMKASLSTQTMLSQQKGEPVLVISKQEACTFSGLGSVTLWLLQGPARKESVTGCACSRGLFAAWLLCRCDAKAFALEPSFSDHGPNLSTLHPDDLTNSENLQSWTFSV